MNTSLDCRAEMKANYFNRPFFKTSRPRNCLKSRNAYKSNLTVKETAGSMLHKRFICCQATQAVWLPMTCGTHFA